jgi:hypothetical protein
VLNASGLEPLMLPSTAQTVVICADRDASGGKRAAHNVCARTREAMLVHEHDSTVPAVPDVRPRTTPPSLGADAPPCLSMGNDREGYAPAPTGQYEASALIEPITLP